MGMVQRWPGPSRGLGLRGCGGNGVATALVSRPIGIPGGAVGSDFCKSHCLPISIREAVHNVVKLLREAKVWETEADIEVETGGKVTGARKATSNDVDWHDEESGNIADRLLEIYREWASVFSEEEINRLPDHTKYDHRIEMIEGAVPPCGPIYPLSKSCKHSANT
jgi:hypothetical protein